jgi:hypothetical protein
MKRLSILLLFLGLLVQSSLAQSTAVKVTPEERRIADGVTAKQLRDYLYFVASDEMEGRDTPSRGLDTTAKFIATNLSRWGFKPAGDNETFFQKIALTGETIDPSDNSLQVGDRKFKYGDDFYRLAGNGTVDGQMVFVRDGWVVKSKNIDAYQGVDVKDKIVVVYGGGFPRSGRATSPPAGVTEEDLKGPKGTDWADPFTYAKANGARGMIVVASPQAEGAWAQLANFLGRGNLFPEKLREKAADPSFPIVLINKKTADAVFAGEAGDRDSATSFAINKSVSIKSASHTDTKWTQNVVAVWEGSDPLLKNEMVAIGAHYDHVGKHEDFPGPDKIFNGADDDGSGTVSVLSIAEALAKAPKRPKRSVLFVWHCGEEKGLWGSEYFNKFPTVDIKNVVAQLNIDMIGRSRKPDDTNPKNKDLSGENAIYVIGSEMMSSTLGSVVKGTNAGYLGLTYDFKYDDPKDPERFFFRSDHFNYALNGIPITFWFDGVHEDYHKPGDEPQKIDYAKMEKVARTIMITLLNLTDLKERPAVDKDLPPELKKK